MKEYFDILNEFGEPIGIKKERSKVHKDGDWHKAVHIWILNEAGDILLQRRSPNKDSDPNVLDISCAGHLTSGDNSIQGAIRELKEELNLEVNASELKYITTLKRSPKHDDGFIDNEFDDLYILRTNKKIEELKYQEEEISEIFYVPYKEFKKMVENRQSDLVIYEDEYDILFNIFDPEFDKVKVFLKKC